MTKRAMTTKEAMSHRWRGLGAESAVVVLQGRVRELEAQLLQRDKEVLAQLSLMSERELKAGNTAGMYALNRAWHAISSWSRKDGDT